MSEAGEEMSAETISEAERIMEKVLETRVGSALRDVVGSRLIDVGYLCLEGDVPASSGIDDPRLSLGGEIELVFDARAVQVTWDGNAGWDQRFSLQVIGQAAFGSETRRRLSARDTGLWRPFLNSAEMGKCAGFSRLRPIGVVEP